MTAYSIPPRPSDSPVSDADRTAQEIRPDAVILPPTHSVDVTAQVRGLLRVEANQFAPAGTLTVNPPGTMRVWNPVAVPKPSPSSSMSVA